MKWQFWSRKTVDIYRFLKYTYNHTYVTILYTQWAYSQIIPTVLLCFIVETTMVTTRDPWFSESLHFCGRLEWNSSWPILYTLYNLSWQRHSHWDQKTQGLVSAHLLDCPSNGPITLPYMVLTILSNDYTIVLQKLVASTYSSSLYPMWPPCIPPFWHCRRGCGRA